MASINCGRMWMGGLVGGLAWVAWSTIVNIVFLGPRYEAAQAAGHFLSEPRYGLFTATWILILMALGVVVSLLYSSVRGTCGAGPKTALIVGLLFGFAAGVPANFAMATWGTFDRIFPFWWMLELWLGAIIAALTAGSLYKEAGAKNHPH